jgi:hypothetical protein
MFEWYISLFPLFQTVEGEYQVHWFADLYMLVLLSLTFYKKKLWFFNGNLLHQELELYCQIAFNTPFMWSPEPGCSKCHQKHILITNYTAWKKNTSYFGGCKLQIYLEFILLPFLGSGGSTVMYILELIQHSECIWGRSEALVPPEFYLGGAECLLTDLCLILLRLLLVIVLAYPGQRNTFNCFNWDY